MFENTQWHEWRTEWSRISNFEVRFPNEIQHFFSLQMTVLISIFTKDTEFETDSFRQSSVKAESTLNEYQYPVICEDPACLTK